jgi:hypothetical protein
VGGRIPGWAPGGASDHASVPRCGVWDGTPLAAGPKQSRVRRHYLVCARAGRRNCSIQLEMRSPGALSALPARISVDDRGGMLRAQMADVRVDMDRRGGARCGREVCVLDIALDTA